MAPRISVSEQCRELIQPKYHCSPSYKLDKKVGQPTHVLVKASDNGLKKDSMVLCENPQRMSKENVGRYIGRLTDSTMREVAAANLLATAAISYLDVVTLVSAWSKAVELNAVALA